jgi:hypothetical protein
MGLYEAFLARGDRGRDALAAYQHLLYTYRKQGTNQPWATTRYLMAGLSMGRDKVKRAKALLREMGLIEYVQRQLEGGRLGKTYTKLNLLPNPGLTAGLKSGTAADSTAGLATSMTVTPSNGARTQLLEEEIKKRESLPASSDSAPVDTFEDDLPEQEASHA